MLFISEAEALLLNIVIFFSFFKFFWHLFFKFLLKINLDLEFQLMLELGIVCYIVSASFELINL